MPPTLNWQVSTLTASRCHELDAASRKSNHCVCDSLAHLRPTPELEKRCIPQGLMALTFRRQGLQTVEAFGSLAVYFFVFEFFYYHWHRAMHKVRVHAL